MPFEAGEALTAGAPENPIEVADLSQKSEWKVKSDLTNTTYLSRKDIWSKHCYFHGKVE